MTTSKDSPLVSVLVPLYNHERYIVSCLDSIMRDEYPNKEVIVVDDGSKDASLRVAHEWRDANRHFCPDNFTITTRPNRGISKTLNELISLASGQYLCFVSSDDFLWPGGIGARIQYLREHPDRLAVLGDCAVVDGNGDVTIESVIEGYYKGRKAILADEQLFSYEIIFNWSIAGPAFMADRRAFELVGGYDESLQVEDWDMYLRLAARELLGFVDSRVAAYRIHGNNLILSEELHIPQIRSLKETAKKNALSFSGIKRYCLIHHFLMQKGNLAASEGRRRLARNCRRLARIIHKISEQRYSALLDKRGFSR